MAGFCWLAVLAPAVQAGTLQPAPQQQTLEGVPITLGVDVGLVGSNGSARMSFALGQLAAALGGGGFGVSVGGTGAHAVSIRLQRSGDPLPLDGLPSDVVAFPAMGDEGYLIKILPAGAGLRIIVWAPTDHGLWNGAMTLRQLLLSDAGPAEVALAPQRIRDYADHPLRVSAPLDFEFTAVDSHGDYAVSSAQLATLDRLAQLKINTVIFPTRTLATSAVDWAQSRTGIAALQRAAADRFIDLWPSLGTLQSDWAPTYRDGWWIRDEPMKFNATTQEAEPDDKPGAGRRSGDLVLNGSFESASAGVPTSWTLAGTGSPGATWTRDSAVHAAGSYSMRLDVTTGNPAVILSQNVPGPMAAGHYLVSARLRTQNVTGTPPRLKVRAMSGTQALSPPRHLITTTGSYEWERFQGFLRIPTGQAADRLEVSIAWESGSGVLWVDDVRVTRIDADLRNVMRRAYDVRVTSADHLAVYQPGVDYQIVDGTFDDVYAPELAPTRLLRPVGSALAPGVQFLVSYDKNLFPGVRSDSAPSQTSGAGQQGLNLCTSQALTDLYQPALARLLVDLAGLNPDLPVRGIFLHGDEIRGFNRSGACRNLDGTLTATNAQRLAAFLQNVIDAAKALRPDITLYAWGDMLSPAHNGGVPSYQVDLGDPLGLGKGLGGSSGSTFCVLAPSAPGCSAEGVGAALGNELHVVSWWAGVLTLFQKNFSAAFLHSVGRPFLLASTSDLGTAGWDQGIRDLAAIGAAMPSSKGFLDAFDGHVGALELKASLAWNDEWKQVFYEPFEFGFYPTWDFAAGQPPQSAYTVTTGAISATESCASPALFEPQTDKTLPAVNAGGVCINTPGGSLTLPALPVDNSLHYRVSFQSRSGAAIAGTLRLHWHPVHSEDRIEDVPIQIGSSSGWWVRSQADVVPWRGPGDPLIASVSAEIVVPGWAKIDDFMLWEERPGCPVGDAVVSVAPPTISNASALSLVSFSVAVTNLGCRDLHVTGIGSVPDIAVQPTLDNLLPIVIRAGSTQSIMMSGRLVAGVSVPGSIALSLATNDPSSPTVWTTATLQPPPACGLLGAEPLALLALSLGARRLRRRRALRTRRGCAGHPRARGSDA